MILDNHTEQCSGSDCEREACAYLPENARHELADEPSVFLRDRLALNEIATLLESSERWTVEHLESIAAILRRSGRTIS